MVKKQYITACDQILIYLLHTIYTVRIHKTKGSFISEFHTQEGVQIKLDFEGENVIRLLWKGEKYVPSILNVKLKEIIFSMLLNVDWHCMTQTLKENKGTLG